ncbi:FabD/lysophospholipase-like protein [Piedraia hortae CBS 480.64]|uniref:FabD/lysophospholipase-like protein n=1 Tax=Piedraia hortae CBS 480.64 TaxID=1314780 RepID=A0A6A7C4A2_9PEZI|nr:FabD/lysophospholipase-like protein [Piedraia hortae CBS 480.64]
METHGSLRYQASQNRGLPLRVLSLDGGGVRGYSMLVILQELMHRTFVELEGRAPRRHEIPKPCDHFDLIVGTGTGGLIALMLGRMRMDLDTCKDCWARMTRRVFETDKTFAGIPYKSTMFKASKLEEAIRDALRDHTGPEADRVSLEMATRPTSPGSQVSPQRSPSQSSRYSQLGVSPVAPRGYGGYFRPGNPNALLYDAREYRTKTAVAAVMKGTTQTVLLRSYDARKEPAPDVNCTIWQAGRATAATGMAFKPIKIGQTWYLDEGAGKFNPSPLALDEAENEWPGREIGVFVSIGTGKRPAVTNTQSHEWWENLFGGTMGDFAEARRRLILKMEGCEETHQFMIRDYLTQRRVSLDNYYRFNVEIGVGEFGMNEWHRLSEISTHTRLYLANADVESLTLSAAAKLAQINDTRTMSLRMGARPRQGSEAPAFCPPANPTAIELPGDEAFLQNSSARPSVDGRSFVSSRGNSPPNRQSSHYYPNAPQPDWNSPIHGDTAPPPPPKVPPPYPDRPAHHTVSTYPHYPTNPALSTHVAPANASHASPMSPARSHQYHPAYGGAGPLTDGRRLPYPDVTGPPPVINMNNKPNL